MSSEKPDDIEIAENGKGDSKCDEPLIATCLQSECQVLLSDMFDRFLAAVTPKSDDPILSLGQEKILSMQQLRKLLLEEYQMLSRRLAIAQEMVDARLCAQECQQRSIESTAALIRQSVNAIEQLKQFAIDTNELRERVIKGYNKTDDNNEVIQQISSNVDNSVSHQMYCEFENFDIRGSKEENGGNAIDVVKTYKLSNRVRLQDLACKLKSQTAMQVFCKGNTRLHSNINEQSERLKLPAKIEVKNEPRVNENRRFENTYIVPARMETDNNDNKMAEKSNKICRGSGDKDARGSAGSSELDGSFWNLGCDQKTVLMNASPVVRMPQPDFDDSSITVTVKFSDVESGMDSSKCSHQNIDMNRRPKASNLLPRSSKKARSPTVDDRSRVCGPLSIMAKPAMPKLRCVENYDKVQKTPALPLFRSVELPHKQTQLSAKKVKPKVGVSTAFKPVQPSVTDDENPQDGGKKTGLPTPLRRYHRRSLAADAPTDATYMVSTDDSQTEDCLTSSPKSKLSMITKKQYAVLPVALKEQLRLADLNEGIKTLAKFVESTEATVFTRKTIEKAVSNLLDSKQAMIFTSALAETGKLMRLESKHNQTVFTSNGSLM